MEQNVKELWIDDLRDPKSVLGSDGDSVVWKKDAWEAKGYLFHEAAPVVEKIYLDNNLGDPEMTGEDLLGMLSFHLERFPNLKVVYLHSSDDEAIKKMLNHKSRFDKHNVDLLEAPYRSKWMW